MDIEVKDKLNLTLKSNSRTNIKDLSQTKLVTNVTSKSRSFSFISENLSMCLKPGSRSAAAEKQVLSKDFHIASALLSMTNPRVALRNLLKPSSLRVNRNNAKIRVINS